MCLNHRECASVVELIAHLAEPNCMASSFVTQICVAAVSVPDAAREELTFAIAKQLAISPDSQLDKFYRDQAAKLVKAAEEPGSASSG
jgi:hypothetical protein